jgi:O-acetyl-ADP-ribose deacetylase (regulator of RNase III)
MDEPRERSSARIEVVETDITTLAVDAIVNAANETLLGGGGVDGAIHRAAGPRLLQECRTLGGCPTGSARLTRGYDLCAGWVIHAVGPVWSDGTRGEAALLAACYDECLRIAAGRGLASLAFPAISTGAYGFPKPGAAAIAVERVLRWLTQNELPQRVVFACFSARDGELYRAELGRARAGEYPGAYPGEPRGRAGGAGSP